MFDRLSLLFFGRGAVVKNFIALGILQGTNFLIPLIIMPYLVATIGIDGYGVVSFVQAVMIYFYGFTDYGFIVSATRDLATNRDNNAKVSEIFNTVLYTKLFLGIISAIVLATLVYTIPFFKNESLAYILGFTIVLGQTILPVWFFQGMEKMKYITYLNLFAKILFTVLIFIFINQPSDYPLVLLFFGLGNLLSGIIGVFLAIYQFKIKLSLPSIKNIRKELVEGWNLFIANFAIVAYINSNIFILGLFTNNTITGYYSIAEKITMAMRQILVVFSQATYPHICQLVNTAHKKIQIFYRQIFIPFVLLFLVFSILVFFTAEPIILFLTDSIEPQIVFLLKLMCFVPFIVALNIPAYQTLLAYRHQRNCTLILTVGSVLNIALNLMLAPQLGAFGTALSVIATEIFITLGLHYMLEYKHPGESLFTSINNTD